MNISQHDLSELQRNIINKYSNLDWHQDCRVVYLTHGKGKRWTDESYLAIFYNDIVSYYQNGDAKWIKIQENEIFKYHKLETTMRNFK